MTKTWMEARCPAGWRRPELPGTRCYGAGIVDICGRKPKDFSPVDANDSPLIVSHQLLQHNVNVTEQTSQR